MGEGIKVTGEKEYPNWKSPSVKPNLRGNQKSQADFARQRKCPKCSGENFKVFMGNRPQKDRLAHLLVCSHCGYPKWLPGNRNPS